MFRRRRNYHLDMPLTVLHSSRGGRRLSRTVRRLIKAMIRPSVRRSLWSRFRLRSHDKKYENDDFELHDLFRREVMRALSTSQFVGPAVMRTKSGVLTCIRSSGFTTFGDLSRDLKLVCVRIKTGSTVDFLWRIVNIPACLRQFAVVARRRGLWNHVTSHTARRQSDTMVNLSVNQLAGVLDSVKSSACCTDWHYTVRRRFSSFELIGCDVYRCRYRRWAVTVMSTYVDRGK